MAFVILSPFDLVWQFCLRSYGWQRLPAPGCPRPGLILELSTLTTTSMKSVIPRTGLAPRQSALPAIFGIRLDNILRRGAKRSAKSLQYRWHLNERRIVSFQRWRIIRRHRMNLREIVRRQYCLQFRIHHRFDSKPVIQSIVSKALGLTGQILSHGERNDDSTGWLFGTKSWMRFSTPGNLRRGHFFDHVGMDVSAVFASPCAAAGANHLQASTKPWARTSPTHRQWPGYPGRRRSRVQAPCETT